VCLLQYFTSPRPSDNPHSSSYQSFLSENPMHSRWVGTIIYQDNRLCVVFSELRDLH
jgi:hypothetical protein